MSTPSDPGSSPDQRPRPLSLETEADVLAAVLRAQEAFIAFTEAIGTQINELDLARQAIAVLESRFTNASIGYYVPHGSRWQARAWSSHVTPDLSAQMMAGFPADTPMIAQVLQANEAVFTEAWDPVQQQIEISGAYGAVATVPLPVQGQIQGLLSIGLKDTQVWTAQDRALVQAVGRGLTLALERSQVALQLEEQTAELSHRTRALEAVAELTRDLRIDADALQLVRRAQDLVTTLIPGGFAVYYELDGNTWALKSQVGSPEDPVIQASLESALPYDAVQNFRLPWESGEAFYQNAYDPSLDADVPGTTAISSTATLPLLVGSHRQGIFGYGLKSARAWTKADKTVLEILLRSLGLALERQVQARSLEEERVSLDAFVQFTVAAGQATDVSLLADQARTVLETMLDVTVGYSELEDGLWKGRVFSEAVPAEVVEAARLGFPADLPSFRRPFLERQPVFVDGWDAQAEGAEVTEVYDAAALYPYFRNGDPASLLTMGSLHAGSWTERERAIFLAVGRSLGLALERAQQAKTLGDRSRQLEQSNGALQVSNEELEAFGYSLSHDLQTPVRHVMGFANLAERSLQQGKGEATLQHLKVIQGAGLQMKRLIDAMLKHAQTSSQELRTAPVDLNLLVRRARQEIERDPAGRPVNWQIQVLPVVQGDQALLQQVITNLLANAVKFTRSREHARIDLWAEETEATWAISLRDNGVGFDPKYADKLFQVFQRLHPHKEFEGTGVGLATVRRILIRHGGGITARGAVDQGATFQITLPK